MPKLKPLLATSGETSSHAAQSREISANLEQLAAQLERLLHQFTLSSDNNA
ncbi:hypothetical protein [Photobacterium kagoshimensis]|uniref:hypothetical protein n=1 Tax=Photobacterium kagoshimensis TaxID=2910242 RepID=UPI003D098D84